MSLSFLKAAYVLHGPDVLVGALIAIGVAALFKWIRDWREHLVALLPFVLVAPLIMRFVATIPVSEPHHPDAVMVARLVGLGLTIIWMAIASKAYRRWRKVESRASTWWTHLAVYVTCAVLVTSIGRLLPLSTPTAVTDDDPVSAAAPEVTSTPESPHETNVALQSGETIKFESDWSQDEISRYLLLNFETSELVPSEDYERTDEKRREIIRKLVEEAADGILSSTKDLAILYAKGRWLNQDQFEATRLYLSAASAGDVESQAEMGYRLSEGLGTAKDIKAAIEWTAKAANAGNTRAQQNLGFFSQRGVGMLKDEESAYFWYLLAAAGGSDDAAAFRDELEQRLSPEQRAAAQQRAKDWKPSTTGS